MKILYVEDNPANIFLIKRVARMGKHEVVNYIDGEEALENFEKDDPDLVLMDIQLAGDMTGLDVVRKLRQDGYKTPIIAVTAYAMAGDRERFLEAGCTDYMAKPLPVPQLVNLIQSYEQEIEQTDSTIATRPTVSKSTAQAGQETSAPKETVDPAKKTGETTRTNSTLQTEMPDNPVGSEKKTADSVQTSEVTKATTTEAEEKSPQPKDVVAPQKKSEESTDTAESAGN